MAIARGGIFFSNCCILHDGNSPSIPRIQARMQWFLCSLSENSLQRFEHGEIDAKIHGEIDEIGNW